MGEKAGNINIISFCSSFGFKLQYAEIDKKKCRFHLHVNGFLGGQRLVDMAVLPRPSAKRRVRQPCPCRPNISFWNYETKGAFLMGKKGKLYVRFAVVAAAILAAALFAYSAFASVPASAEMIVNSNGNASRKGDAL